MKSIHTILSRVHAILNGKRNESPATNQTENLWKKCISRMAGVLAVCLLFSGSVWGQALLTESFDGSTFVPTGWTYLGTGGTCTIPSTWTRVTTGTFPTISNHSGAGMAKFNSYDATATCYRSIASPAMNFSTVGTKRISFWMYRDNGQTPADKLDIYTNTSASLTSATLIGTVNRSISLSPIVTSSGWYQYYFDVTSTNSSTYLIFKGTSAWGNNIYLDDISVNNVATWTGATNTDWGTASNWSTSSIPTSGYYVVIAAAANQPIIGAAATCASITLNSGTSLAINSTLAVGGNWTNNSATSAVSGTGTVTFSGTTSIGGTFATTFPNLTISGGTTTNTITGTSVVGTYSQTAGTFIMSTSASNVYTLNFKDISLTGTGIVSTSTGTLSGISTIINITGSYTQGAGTTWDTPGNGVGQMNFTGGGNTTYSNSGTISYNGIKVTNNTTLTLLSNLTFTGWLTSGTNLILESGSFLSAGTYTITNTSTGLTWAISGTLKTANSNGLSGSTTTTLVSTNTPTITLGSASTIEYNAAGTQTVTARTDYANVTLSGSGIKTFTATPTIAKILSIQGTATAASATPTYGAAATLEYKGSTAQTTGVEFPATFSGSGGVIINNANGVTLGASKAISSGLTLTSGAFASGAYTLTYSGSGSSIARTSGTLDISNASGGLTFTNATTALTLPASLFTGNVKNLTMNGTGGVTLNNAVTLSGILTLTSGKLTTTSSNLLTISNTATSAVSGGSSSSYVNGPIALTLPASLASGSTYVFPVGKGTYNPFSLVNPTTTSGGTVTVNSEVFDSNAGGTAGTGLASLNTNRYWATSITSGSGNFTNSLIKLDDSSIASISAVTSSTTLTGTYDIVGGTSPTVVVGTSVTSVTPEATTLPGYFAIGSFPLPMSYSSSTTTQNVTSITQTNTSNQQIIGMQVVTSGNTSPLDATSFTINTTGTTAAITDITNAKIWYTGASATFATTTQFGSTVASPNGSHVITGTQTLSEGTNYFWLTYDIPTTATTNNLVDAQFTAVTVGGTSQAPTASTITGTRTIKGVLNGVYNIGASQVAPNYTLLTNAIADLGNYGVSGAVTFQLMSDYSSATETFPLTINAYTGASATNTLTIKPASGVTATISGSAATSALIKIASKYVTIDGSNTAGGTTRDLTITNTSTTTPNVILIGNSGTSTGTALTNVTLKNTILINGVNTATAVIVANNLAAAGYFNTITIQNNSVQKAYIGIYALATAAAGNGSGLLITGNDLNATSPNALSYTGIFVQGVDGATVSNNNIANITSSTVSPNGVVFNTGTNSGSIYGNTISALSYTGTYDNAPSGIVSTATTATNISIYNNIISNISSSATEYYYSPIPSGIYISSINTSAYNNKIFNIKQTNSGGEPAFGINLSSASTTSGISVYNNFIFDIAGYGYSALSIYNGYGIGLLSGGGYNLYNNTINMNTNQTTGVSSAIYIYSSLVTAASVNIRNNIFANTQTAGASAANRYAIYCAAANTIFGTINHNDYYSAGTNLGYIGSARVTLANIVTGFGGNANSISALPSFTSATDLHLTTSGNCSINNAGTPISGITTDYDGDTRSSTTPDIGADEFSGNNTAAAASSTPTLCINTALTNITHVTTGATGISNSGVSGGNGLPTGVSAAWASNTITISGTPTASGTFNYSIPLTGGCGNGSATGTITVTAANTAAAASSTPTLCINTALTAITHTTTGATGIGTATSLPTGVSAAWSSNTITISGTPTASGTFNYIIPLTGGCGGINATGTITVTTNTAAAASSTPTLCINTVLTNITHATTDATGIGTATGLPAGVSAAWASNTITISGTPSASGVFGYSIPLSGGCGSVNATGTITVSPPTVAGSIAAASSSVCSGTGTTLTLSGNTGTIEWQSSTDNVTYGTISGATTSSLSTGNLTQAKYFKALVSSGTCSAASTSVQVITIYANGTYIGPSTGNWNDAANWCGGLPSNATNVVISSGDVVTLNINAETTVATMTINGSLIVPSTAQLTVIGLLTNNGTFTLKDGATFIQGTSGTSITGNGTFNVEKALADNSSTWTTTSGRFWYMGVPMVNVVRSGYGTTGTTTNRVWSYAESTKSYTELTDGNALLSAGTGYVHRRSTDGTITFSAIGADGLYRSDVNISGLTRTAGTSAGYHLVSNPYMAYLDWYSVTKTNIEPTFYIRTNNTTNSNISALISYNSETDLSTNTSSVTATTAQLRYIAPLQSIWVRVGTAASTGSLAMTRGILSHQIGNVGLKSSTVFPALARVNLVDGNKFDQLLVYLNSDMSNEVDQYDSEKMLSSGTVQVYTMSSNKKLVMNGLKNNKKKVSVPLYLELPETKSYTLQLSEYMMEDGLILLEDKQEGTLQDFTINENYSFFANSGLLQNRFVLHFILPNAELTTQGPSNSWVTEEGSYTEGGDVEIFNDDRGNIQITVNQPEDQKVEGNVCVTDMSGKAVYTGQLAGIITAIELDVPSGIYYLTVQSGTLIEKKKVFIQD